MKIHKVIIEIWATFLHDFLHNFLTGFSHEIYYLVPNGLYSQLGIRDGGGDVGLG